MKPGDTVEVFLVRTTHTEPWGRPDTRKAPGH